MADMAGSNVSSLFGYRGRLASLATPIIAALALAGPLIAVRPLMAATALSAGSAALADDYLARVNDQYKSITADKRSDSVLLPLMGKMAKPPRIIDEPLKAALLPATATDWTVVEAWATADEQKAVLEALKTVTEELDHKKSYAFGLPYGGDKADPDLVATGMYVELGDPPTLAGADFKYLPAMVNLGTLIQAETTRLLNDGKPFDALMLLTRGIHLGRQMADRAFFREKTVGLDMMLLCFNRLRDAAYFDAQTDAPKLTAENFREVLRRIRERDGIVGLDRLRLPQGDQAGAEQLFARIMVPGAGPDEAAFASVLSDITVRERPLRKFSEYAKWDAIRRLHGDEKESRTQLANVYGDWEKRWKQKPTDPSLKLPSDYQKLSKAKFAAVSAVVGDIGGMFEMRRILRVEIDGTRVALGISGFQRLRGSFPPALTSPTPDVLRPQDITPDSLSGEALRPYGYFVPGRDFPHQPKDSGKGIDMQIFATDLMGKSFTQFGITLLDDTFVLFSVGPDTLPNGCRRATQMVEDDKGDYLIYPSILTLVRKNLNDQKRFN